MSEAMARQREEWLSLVDELNARIKSLDAWLGEQAKRDERVLRLQTHHGIGLLTSLALAHCLEPVTRFAGERKEMEGEKWRMPLITDYSSRLHHNRRFKAFPPHEH